MSLSPVVQSSMRGWGVEGDGEGGKGQCSNLDASKKPLNRRLQSVVENPSLRFRRVHRTAAHLLFKGWKGFTFEIRNRRELGDTDKTCLAIRSEHFILLICTEETPSDRTVVKVAYPGISPGREFQLLHHEGGLDLYSHVFFVDNDCEGLRGRQYAHKFTREKANGRLDYERGLKLRRAMVLIAGGIGGKQNGSASLFSKRR